MGFLGIWQGSIAARAVVEARAAHLYAGALRLSLDHRVLICYNDCGGIDEEAFSRLFRTFARNNRIVRSDADTVVWLYKRCGRRFIGRLPWGGAVAVYDSSVGRLYLHGSGKKVFLEETADGILFSSERRLLRQSVCADAVILK